MKLASRAAEDFNNGKSIEYLKTWDSTTDIVMSRTKCFSQKLFEYISEHDELFSKDKAHDRVTRSEPFRVEQARAVSDRYTDLLGAAVKKRLELDCQVSCFEDYLKPSSTCPLSFNKPIIILGDLNCNLLQTNPDGLSWLNFASEMNLKQLITSPTRITESSRSLIDVVMTSTPDLVHESGVISTSISEHFPVYMVLNTKLPKQPPSYITVRSYKNYDPTLFTADLVSKYDTLLQSIFTVNEVNLKLSKFDEALLSTLQIHAPVKTIRVRNRPVPYVTQSIKDLMTHGDQLHQQFKLSRDVTDWSSYKNAKQSVKTVPKKAEEIMVKYLLTKIILHLYGKLLIAAFLLTIRQFNATVKLRT